MKVRGRTLRFTAVTAMVVLVLTGFSTGKSRGHSSSRHGSGGGGGCSSSKQDHDSSSSTTGGSTWDSDDDSYGSSTSGDGSSYNRRPNYRSTPTTSSTGGSGRALKDGKARLISCASEKAQYATVEVTNPNNRETSFEVRVDFEDDQDIMVGHNSVTVDVPAKGRTRTRVKLRDITGFANDGLIDEVDHCKVDPEADVR